MAEKKDKKDKKKDKKKTKPPKVSMKQTTKQTVTINLAKSPAKRRRSKGTTKETSARPTPGPIYITNPQPTIVPNPVDYARIESFIPKPADFARIEAPVDYPRIGDMIRETANMFIPPKPQVEYVPITESIPVTESTKPPRLTLRKPTIRKQLTEEQKERKRIYDRNRRQMQKQLRSGTWEDTASIVEEEM